MNWQKMKLKKKKAEAAVADMQAGNLDMPELNAEEKRLREKLLSAWQDAGEAAKEETQKYEYRRDLEFALRIYDIFSCGEYAMPPRIAADTTVWSYICIRLIPDIVRERWPKEVSWAERFYKRSTRIYLRTLWWYIYLSWQGDAERTRLALLGNSSDIIVQLVERSGRHGYRPELYRNIMRYFFALEMTDPQYRNAMYFRKVMKLHTARCASIEPEMARDGVGGYVKELFNYFKER